MLGVWRARNGLARGGRVLDGGGIHAAPNFPFAPQSCSNELGTTPPPPRYIEMGASGFSPLVILDADGHLVGSISFLAHAPEHLKCEVVSAACVLRFPVRPITPPWGAREHKGTT